jgi:hypothetical protein
MARIFQLVLLAAMLVAPAMSMAALQFSTTGDVIQVRGTYQAGDVAVLKDKLTPEIKTVILSNATGGNWENGHDLAEVIEKANVTTVIHGICSGYVCSMMFLAGKQRMFSGDGRPATHHIQIPIINNLPSYTCDGVPCTAIPAWLRQHSKLSNSDLEVYHKSVFVSTTNRGSDLLEFFPSQANVSVGNALHCAREVMEEKQKDFSIADCKPIPGATALNKGIVTTDELFKHPTLSIREDRISPPPTDYAKLETPPDSKVTSSDECRRIYAKFLRNDSPRAFVVSSTGACYSRVAQNFHPHADAMNDCKKSNKKCRFYAVDTAIVFVPFDQALPKIPTQENQEE